MRNAVSTVGDRGHLFVLAGLRPGGSLEQQTTKDLRTICTDFLAHDFDFGLKVVHGHTITVSGDRKFTALDRGAEQTGHLTAAVIADGTIERFLRTAVSSPGWIDVEHVEPEDFRSGDLLERVLPAIRHQVGN